MMNQKPQEINTLYAPIFSDEWKEQSLYPLADWLNGMAFRDFNFSSDGKPVIKIAEIKNGISGQTKFTNEKYDSKYLLKKGDMLFCWSGQPQTSIDVFWWSGPEGWLNQHIFKVTTKLESKLFFFYLLKYLKPNFVQIAINKQTTGLGHVTKGDLERFIVKLPKTEEQRAIAAVLSSLDDKIELLREHNKTLEATAQTIFKEWFVNFNFPGATGKMIDSELGEIPEGWKVDRLSEIIVFEGGAQPPKSEHIYEPRDGYVRFIQNRDYSNSSHITYIKESKKNKLCEVYDIMMDKYGDVGVPRWGLVGAYNVALAKIVPKIKNSREYLRSYFSQRAVFSLLSASAQASTRGSLNEGTFKGVTLIIPDEITLERFEKLQSKFLSKILFNNAEVETLSQLRDTLLPKLMKGDVQVKGFKD